MRIRTGAHVEAMGGDGCRLSALSLDSHRGIGYDGKISRLHRRAQPVQPLNLPRQRRMESRTEK